MSNSISITGSVVLIHPTKVMSEKFSKREFVVETEAGTKYPQKLLLEATGRSIDELDRVRVGDEVKVDINLRGREWKAPGGETKYFNTLSAWKIETLRNAAAPSNSDSRPDATGGYGPEGDIPF